MEESTQHETDPDPKKYPDVGNYMLLVDADGDIEEVYCKYKKALFKWYCHYNHKPFPSNFKLEVLRYMDEHSFFGEDLNSFVDTKLKDM